MRYNTNCNIDKSERTTVKCLIKSNIFNVIKILIFILFASVAIDQRLTLGRADAWFITLMFVSLICAIFGMQNIIDSIKKFKRGR